MISAGLSNDIQPEVLSSVQCDITLKCLNCELDGLDNIDECTSTVSFNESEMPSTFCYQLFVLLCALHICCTCMYYTSFEMKRVRMANQQKRTACS